MLTEIKYQCSKSPIADVHIKFQLLCKMSADESRGR